MKLQWRIANHDYYEDNDYVNYFMWLFTGIGVGIIVYVVCYNLFL